MLESTCSVIWYVTKRKKINKRRNKYLLHPYSLFLCETCILGGRLILSYRTPLQMTFGGSFSPFAFTASATVKLCLSAPQVVISTVWFPVNSSVRVAGNSNRIGVSSMLMMWLSGYSQRLRALTTNWWNVTILSSMLAGRRWARVVLVRMEIEWRRFQSLYHPSDALNSGSVLSSFLMPFTERTGYKTKTASISKCNEQEIHQYMGMG